mgnify:FL=1|tara:strand:+ start:893 stop:1357 length:465 start_codon:yes stop_codon:yes gene_type:complete
MKKILSLLILTILLDSCGFKIIKPNKYSQINIQNIEIKGNKNISFLLKNSILLNSNENSKNIYDVTIELKKNKINKIKDGSGKTKRVNVSITANLNLKEINRQNSINRKFEKNADYDVAKNHSDTINNEKIIDKNLIKQLSDDIISFITLVILN